MGYRGYIRASGQKSCRPFKGLGFIGFRVSGLGFRGLRLRTLIWACAGPGADRGHRLQLSSLFGQHCTWSAVGGFGDGFRL